MSQLPHLNQAGAARMVDVGDKEQTRRTATARGRLLTNGAALAAIKDSSLAKGDALAVARVAAMMAAKRTAELIPLCHPIAVSGIDVDLQVTESAVEIEVTCRCAERTGVEMEALTGVAIAGLTLHDMIKAIDPGATLTDVQLISKTGGRSGRWTRGGDSQ